MISDFACYKVVHIYAKVLALITLLTLTVAFFFSDTSSLTFPKKNKACLLDL